MKINVMPVGELQTNCYIVQTDAGGAVVIDAGGDAVGIMGFLQKNKLTLKALLLTHGHFDHVGAVSQLKAATNAPVYIQKEDAEMLLDPKKSFGNFYGMFDSFAPFKADFLLDDGDKINVDELSFTMLHTKGHSKGSAVFLLDDIMFSGDTLFCGSVGRLDLYGSDENAMANSLLKLKQLDVDYRVLAGHGEETTLFAEKRTNPYMGNNYDDIF